MKITKGTLRSLIREMVIQERKKLVKEYKEVTLGNNSTYTVESPEKFKQILIRGFVDYNQNHMPNVVNTNVSNPTTGYIRITDITTDVNIVDTTEKNGILRISPTNPKIGSIITITKPAHVRISIEKVESTAPIKPRPSALEF